MSAIGLPLTIEFGGGAELLFDGKKRHEVDLPGEEWTLKRLLSWLRDNLLTERPELFMQGDTVIAPCCSNCRFTLHINVSHQSRESAQSANEWDRPTTATTNIVNENGRIHYV
ncbi:PREDICTED: ubiquitin-related modifier 1 isoform X1 [Atta colombica]|uniref:ubiquitin-related modifier 1 isoform X1 n=1 Tax=Atta colombica TaxID=520822 RepID=UPI00084C36C7|nr:PREDICTED: ubiquitin-related modifier 1 isoform X1 [Atta colombica]XP_018053560.1 PREDICTED: ubiquitin-related modifier 1 isoform X1 [Atta colombica]